MSKTAKSKELDMLNGKLAGKLILFAIPLAFSSILQQLFNSADVAVVGRFAGDSALAAVGSCVALVGIFVNLIVGLSVGPNAALATLIGQKKTDVLPARIRHCKCDPESRSGHLLSPRCCRCCHRNCDLQHPQRCHAHHLSASQTGRISVPCTGYEN